MKFNSPRWTTLVVLLLITLPVLAQTKQPERATEADLRQLRERVENQDDFPDELRTRIIELHDAAAAALQSSENNRAAARAYERDRGRIDRRVQRLKAELDRPAPVPELTLPDNPTVEQVEDVLARERSLLSANISALREQQRLADERTAARADISRRLGELDLERELLNRELRGQADSSARLELKTISRLHLLARLDQADSEIEMLRARLALMADQSKLIPLDTDLAQRRVGVSQERVALHAELAHQLRLERARTQLTEVRILSRRVTEDLPQLTDLANETESWAELLWGEDGIVNSSERTVKDLASARNHQTQLNRIAELTYRKFQAYGHRGSIQRWWPDIPPDFPQIATITGDLRRLDEEIPEVEHQLINFEQQRSRAHELGRNTLSELRNQLGERLTPEIEQGVQELLAARQDVLDLLIHHGGRYSNQLVEFRTVAGNFLARVQEVERFLFSHILWSRSVPRPVVPRPRDIGLALGWMLSTDHLSDIRIDTTDFRGTLILTILVLLLTLALRPTLKNRLVQLESSVSEPERDSLGLTVRALVVSGLIAAPLPLLLYILGITMDHFGHSTYWTASSRALIELAIVAALLEAIRQIFAPHGLAEVHFGWPSAATRPLHRGLLITEAIGLPLLYVALQLAFAGMRLNSGEDLQLYNNTLGRIAFVAALSVFGLAILSMLRPERKPEPAETEMRVPWPRRFSEYAFPTAFLGAYPIVILATVVPAILAVFGYYLTSLLLAYQMLRTLLLATVVLVGGGLVHRFWLIRRNRELLDNVGDDESEGQIRERETAEKQSRHLFRFAIIGILAVGLLNIWSDALPMLEFLKRVQLLPRIEIIDPGDDTTSGLLSSQTGARAEPTAESGADDPETPTAVAVPGTPTDVQGETGAGGGHPLTLWLLIEAILAASITVILVRNLPGVIEITLKRRTTLDAGARFAFSTLVKYSTTIIGSVVVFSLLGIGWSKVQWLAAALTFGLGFGLQEIVANFVSGLILLIERPVRVGDVVTIGTLMGKVSRIQIRATTITLWDRSEMVVPNKEFITTKLVNWTLSDSKRRIEIPLRVAYGADLEQVKALLIEAASAHPLVLEDPAPQALLLTFGDDAINFELRFVVDFGNGIQAKDDVQMAIDRSFKEHGIGFAVPQLKLQLPKSVTGHGSETPSSDTT